MTKRKPIAQDEARAQLDRLMDKAAQGQLALTDGLREMRAISGLTQEQFAAHRGVGTRVVKALETGQGNPTVATLNRIADVFGLEVAFVPRKRLRQHEPVPDAAVTEDVAERLTRLEGVIARQHDDLLAMLAALRTDAG